MISVAKSRQIILLLLCLVTILVFFVLKAQRVNALIYCPQINNVDAMPYRCGPVVYSPDLPVSSPPPTTTSPSVTSVSSPPYNSQKPASTTPNFPELLPPDSNTNAKTPVSPTISLTNKLSVSPPNHKKISKKSKHSNWFQRLLEDLHL